MTLTKWKPQSFINGGLTSLFDEDFPLMRWKPFGEKFFDVDFPTDEYNAATKKLVELNK